MQWSVERSNEESASYNEIEKVGEVVAAGSEVAEVCGCQEKKDREEKEGSCTVTEEANR